MYPDCLVDCSGWSNMDMLRFMYFRENPMGMTHAHTHSATIMNCNDKEVYKFLMNKVFSITYLDRALIVKNYTDNELVKYHPHLAPIIWWYNALLYRFYWPYSLKKMVRRWIGPVSRTRWSQTRRDVKRNPGCVKHQQLNIQDPILISHLKNRKMVR